MINLSRHGHRQSETSPWKSTKSWMAGELWADGRQEWSPKDRKGVVGHRGSTWGAWEMSLKLRIFIALAEGMGSVPSTHMTAHHHL